MGIRGVWCCNTLNMVTPFDESGTSVHIVKSYVLDNGETIVRVRPGIFILDSEPHMPNVVVGILY